jgi:hypothetical protein
MTGRKDELSSEGLSCSPIHRAPIFVFQFIESGQRRFNRRRAFLLIFSSTCQSLFRNAANLNAAV